MATITRDNVALLTDKLTVTVTKEDYLAGFEQNLKKYAKTANIPGFRKGMVPAGLVKKMYGQSVFTEEVLRTVEKELTEYMTKEQLDIFAQPLPLDSDARMLDMNNPADYAFAFEIGLKPAVSIDAEGIKVTRHTVKVTDEMVNEEIERLAVRHGKMTEPETVTTEENVLNVTFTECDAAGNVLEGGINKANSVLVKYFSESYRNGLMGKKKDDVLDIHLATAFEDKEREWIMSDLGLNANEAGSADKTFKLTITKVGLVEKGEMNAEFFATVYPAKGITTEAEFRQAVQSEIENHWAAQSRNQLHDQIYHHLVDHVHIDLPATFLKRWIQNGGEKPKTAEEAEAEYPSFANSLKWSLITNKLIEDNNITVEQDELRAFARNQMLAYMGMQSIDDAPWLEEYANRMMQDKKFIENTYMNLQTDKLFSLLESKATVAEKEVTAEALAGMQHNHHH
jgi:trigger factor